jgi:GcrA cell cycle regulator
MNWTEERVELLRKLWSEGLSASQIAAQLGSVTRNAVIGKVHRLKLAGRGRTAAQPARAKKPQAAKPAAARPMRPTTPSQGANALQTQFDAQPIVRPAYRPTSDVVVPISRMLSLTDLTERTCKWPNGDPLMESFSFCGNEAGDSGPYCGYHSRLAYQPASERRRVR